MEILRVENVSKQFANHKALDNVSLSIPQGSIYGLLGPNGAGKTTLIRIINHITAPDSGQVFLDQHPLTADDVYSIGYLPEERGLYKKMRVGEQAIFFARLKGLSHSEASTRLHQWFAHFGIEDWWGKKVEELSKGMAQKVQFITTVLHRPRLLIFDEPFSGFDPINANLLKDEILRLRDEGATVIFSTHNMASVEEICDHITLINKAHNILSGSVADVRRKYSSQRYRIVYSGDASRLAEALLGKAVILDESADDPQARAATLRLDNGVAARDIIPVVNDCVDIRSFAEYAPSMNEIFIQAVNDNNLITSTDKNNEI